MTERGAGESGSLLACRREFPERSYERCGKPATHIVWGKLFDKDALGPRCEDCLVEQLGWRLAKDPACAIYKLPTQPSPGSGSEEPLAEIADELRAYPEVRWDRFIEYDGKLGVYGWLARSDGRADFLLLDFDAATGNLLEWITSAHPHPASVVDRLEGEESVECQRVEDTFDIPNAVHLQPESGSGDEADDHVQNFGPRDGDAVGPGFPKGDSGRLAESTPTQPLQGSGVRRRAVLDDVRTMNGPTVARAAQVDSGPIWVKAGVLVMPVADHLEELQRVEEEKDRLRKSAQLALAEESRIAGSSVLRATQAEAHIKQATKTFESWAAEEESRIPGAKKKRFREMHRIAALACRSCAEYLRSQPSSEVGEACRCEGTQLIPRADGNEPCPDCKQEEKTGAELIAAERERQVSEEGWTPEHDDGHTNGEIALAAARYAEVAGRPWSSPTGVPNGATPMAWPWKPEQFKPTGYAVRDLVKAGALIAAEIDRLQRAASPSTPRDEEESK